MAKSSKKGLTGLSFFKTVNDFKLATGGLVPGKDSPVCLKCKLNLAGAAHPYIQSFGSENPSITFVLDAPTRKEDKIGELGKDGTSLFLTRTVADISKKLGLPDIPCRFVPLTRCAVIPPNKGKPATGGKWCRLHALEDLRQFKPRLIVPVGSVALGLLNHKSNAQDWGGKMLTFRGWPDDWLTDKNFDESHPIYGARPEVKDQIPLMPVQSPRLIYGTANPRVIQRWRGNLQSAIQAALSGVVPNIYSRDWWRLTSDPKEVLAALDEIISNPGTIVTFDTETNGLRPFLGNKIVFMMMHWTTKNGQLKSLGWPWDYRSSDAPPNSEVQFLESPMLPYIEELSPWILEALARSKLRGHNLTFDLLFVIGTIPGGLAYLDRICSAMRQDTWHMRYTLRQERGSIGLEILAYDWSKSLAGYEEDFTLLIERYPELLHPEKKGHYANCPQKYWDSAFKSYVMGDVEVCHEASISIQAKLEATKTYAIPLSDPTRPGFFRNYSPPNRDFVYKKIVSPASATLAKMMARGMNVDEQILTEQEESYPKLIFEARQKLREADPALTQWCDMKERLDPEWEFDLGKAEILKEALFGVMNLPINSLTETGAKIYKNLSSAPRVDLIKYASTDKYSINSLAVNYPQVRPLLDYRSMHKQYTSYVRPLRNITTPGIDKKPRNKDRILMLDGRVHPDFKITGTRSGRLSCCVDGDTELEVYANGVKELVKIKDLSINSDGEKFIVTHAYRLRKILRKYEKLPAEMFEVILVNGSKITCTAGHRFLTRSGWKHLRDMSEGDLLTIDRRNNLGWPDETTIDSIKSVGIKVVWDIEVEEDKSYLAQGFVNHNTSPNLQQIPREGLIKKMFTSRFGARGCIYQADLSQIELRLIAAACGDLTMVKAYRENVDLHSLTTSRLFKIPIDHFSDEYERWLQSTGRSDEAKKLKGHRKLGKTVNFLTGYGGGAYGLQAALALQGIYLQLEECEAFLESFFDTYPLLKTHIGYYKRFVLNHGLAVSMFGRVRILEEIYSDDRGQVNKALRAAYNHLIQASASDVMLLMINALERLMRDENLESVIVSTVHDAVVIDAIKDELPILHEIVDSVLNNMPEVLSLLLGDSYDTSWCHIVPFGYSASFGKSYGHEVNIPNTNVDWDKFKALAFAA